MCERSSERLIFKFLLGIIALLGSSSALAQGGDGRTESFETSSATRSRPKVAKVSYRKRQNPVLPKPGTLVISVDETASDVYLARVDGFSMEPQSITTNGPISRSLEAGTYQLRVKKYGYFDETREFDLSPGEYRKVNVTMRPQMALLTLRTNLSDAEIDVENGGKFDKPLKRHLIKPGIYRITLRRRGYVSQTVNADLSLAGKEQSIYVVLEPLRIDSVLWTANEAIKHGELDLASDLVNDVLALNPSHAKANLVRGMIELRRGSEGASKYFLKAIDGGEMVPFQLRVLHYGYLINVDLGVDRESMSFANEKYLDLNFRILRNDLDEFSLATDQDQNPYLSVRGKSNFYGKPIRPEMRLYLAAACSIAVTCRTELDVLSRFIADWRVKNTR